MAGTALYSWTASLAGCGDLFGGRDAVGASIGVAWRKPLVDTQGGANAWHGTPATDGVLAFVETTTGVVALDARSGVTKWEAALWPSRSPAAYNLVAEQGVVYLADRTSVVALEGATGRVRWRVDPPGELGADYIAVGGGSVFAGTRDGQVVALAASDGAEQWRTRAMTSDWTFGGGVSGFAMAGDTLYATGTRFLTATAELKAGAIGAFDRATGRLLWRYQAGGDRTMAGPGATVAGRMLLASDLYGGSFFAVDRFTGREVWRVVGDPRYFGPEAPPVVGGDTVFVGSNDMYVYAADVGTGRVYWKAKTRAGARSYALCGNVVLANEMMMVGVDRRTGRVSGYIVNETGESDDFPTSGIAVAGDVGIVSGTEAIYGVRCP